MKATPGYQAVASVYRCTRKNARHLPGLLGFSFWCCGRSIMAAFRCKNPQNNPVGAERSRLGSGLPNSRPQIRVAVLIDEYFGGWGTPFGGYGFVARRLIAVYLPSDDIAVEVILHGDKVPGVPQTHVIDGIPVHKLSESDFISRQWLRMQRFDVFLSIELTHLDAISLVPEERRHILWIQDPRPWAEWEEINTVTLFPEPCYYNQHIYDYVSLRQRRIRFISQGYFLNPLAKELYTLGPDIRIDYVPNPIATPQGFDVYSTPKTDSVIFLGRLESVKRGWLFCAIAERMPEYQFHVLGKATRDAHRNMDVLSRFVDAEGRSRLPNLHFEGHVDGERKDEFLRNAKVLVNSSIHEALPVSFLEALAYGTLLVSCRDPEGLTSRFGVYTGQVLGDGFDSVDLFVQGIRRIMTDEEWRQTKAAEAVQYVSEVHGVERFRKTMTQIIMEEVGLCTNFTSL